MTLTDAQIRNLLAMEYQASPGPWTKADDAHGIRCPAQGYSITGVASIKGIILEENRDVIIAARNSLRALGEEVLRLRGANDDLEQRAGANECTHGVPNDEHCDWCLVDDECDPPPSLGYVDRTDGDEMLPLLDEPRGSGWLGKLMLGALVAVVVAVVWGCR